MSYLFDGAGDFLQVASAPLTAYPFTIALWFKPTDDTTDMGMAWLGDSSATNNYWSLDASGAVASDPVRNLARNTVERFVPTTTGYALNTWQHACGVYTSGGDRTSFLNGGSKGTGAVSAVPTGSNRFTVGRYGDSTPDHQFLGRLAEVSIWDISLSDGEVATLASGIVATSVQLGDLIGYWPLQADATDAIGALDLTVTGAVLDGDHPTVGSGVDNTTKPGTAGMFTPQLIEESWF